MPELPTDTAALDPTDDAAVDAALTAVENAVDLDQLKEVRLAHAGDRSPLALANRRIGSLDNSQKAGAGKLIGQARGQTNRAIAARTTVLEEERDARIIVERAVDVPAASRRERLGGRHPLTNLMERVGDVFVGVGWEVADGPEVESEWYNFDALNFKPDHPARELQDTFFVDPPEAHLVLRTHTSPVQIRTAEQGAAGLRRRPRAHLPHRQARRHAHPRLPPGRGPGRGQGPVDGSSQGHARALRPTDVRFEAKIRPRPNCFPFTESSTELDW